MRLHKRKCPNCREWYTPFNSLQRSCSKPACAIAVGRMQQRKAQRRKDRATKERLKRPSELAREAQYWFNRFIRLRDRNAPCISCGGNPDDEGLITGSYWHAGHYRSVGACPALRFNEWNVHKQCSQCNGHKSGNIRDFRIGLIQRFTEWGVDAEATIDWLEGEHEPKRYRADDLRAIRDEYKAKARALERG